MSYSLGFIEEEKIKIFIINVPIYGKSQWLSGDTIGKDIVLVAGNKGLWSILVQTEHRSNWLI